MSKNFKTTTEYPNLFFVFLKWVVAMTAFFSLLTGGIIYAYNAYLGTGTGLTPNPDGSNSFIDGVGSVIKGFEDIKTPTKKPLELTVAILGTDEDGLRTDVIIVGHFNSATQQLSLLSIPRDTRIYLDDRTERFLESVDRNHYSPVKINSVHAFGGTKYNSQASVMALEDLLGIEIDNYVRIDFDGFTDLVDAIGGVEIDVPFRMKYTDPYQDLYIDLQPGFQLLDGDAAEQFVRYRGSDGDVGRIDQQQLFLQALLSKVVKSDTIKNNFTDLVTFAFENIQTDFNLMDIINYSKYLEDINLNTMDTMTLPGVGEYVGDVSYFLHDEDALIPTVNRIFRGIGAPEEGKSYDKDIVIANGAGVSGLAGNKKELLANKGYTVSKVYDYKGDSSSITKIIVSESGMGEDLKDYFSSKTLIIIDPSQLEYGSDITIVLGTGEQVVETEPYALDNVYKYDSRYELDKIKNYNTDYGNTFSPNISNS